MQCASTSPTATVSRRRRSASPSPISPRSSRHCWWTTIFRTDALARSFTNALARSFTSAILPALLVAACGGEPKFNGTDITGADYGKSLALRGHDGKPRTLQDFRGKVVLLFFGYTRCPDICPTTMAEAAQAMKSLGADADRVQVLFVTLDPERDTPEVLAKYVPAFDARFIGLYGTEDEVRRTAKEFKIFYEKREGKAPGTYTVDHSAQSYVFDTAGRLRLFMRHDRMADDLPADVRRLLKEKN